MKDNAISLKALSESNQAMKTINTLNDLPRGSRLALFGAGDFGAALLKLFKSARPDISVEFFVDTFKKGNIDSIEIISPDNLVARKADFNFLIITSHAFSAQIQKSVRKEGIDNCFLLNPLFNIEQQDDITSKQDEITAETLYAFYDLAVSPPGFDILKFLFLAEIRRRKHGFKKLHPVIIPRPSDMLTQQGVNYNFKLIRDASGNQWWIRNILVPCCWLMPSCQQITLCSSRFEAEVLADWQRENVYPEGYKVARPLQGYTWDKVFAAAEHEENLPTFRATPKALDYLEPWLEQTVQGRKLVSITLKESPVLPERSSNVGEWVKFARDRDHEEFCPVFVRDTGASLGKLPAELEGCTVFPEIPWNMEMRMALYESSYINMFVANGPAELCLFNRTTRMLAFKVASAADVIYSKEIMQGQGFTEGANYPIATPLQIAVWDEDRLACIKEQFMALCRKIDAEERVK
jgi:hypothetical protein